MPLIRVEPNRLAMLFKQRETERSRRIGAATLEAALLGAEIVARAAPVDVGSLKTSIRARRVDPRTAEVVADAPHAAILEVGSRPHLPPLQPLIDWVRRHVKVLKLSSGLGRDSRGRFRSVTDEQIVETAIAIQHAISVRGTRPRWYMRSTLEKQNRAFAKIVERALKSL